MFWTSSPYGSNSSGRFLLYNSCTVGNVGFNPKGGFSVRCVNDPPTATISGTTEVCLDAAQPDIIFTGITGTAPFTFTYNINGGDNQTVTTISGNSVTVSAPTNLAGIYIYSLVSVEDAFSNVVQTGIATVTINPLPTATISGPPTVCLDAPNPSVILTGNYGTPEYTFSYSVDDSEPRTVISGCGSVGIDVSTVTAGVFTYHLLSVTDYKGCARSISDQNVLVNIPGTTVASTGVTALKITTATLNGVVNANNASTDVTFEYGPTPTYGSIIIATPSPVTGTDITTVSANITGLTANTIYHYRVKAISSGCTTFGDDLTFTTNNSDAITDIDGNFYNIVRIGTQVWMAENLKTTKYNDGSAIANVTDNATWDALTSPAYSWYDNNIANKAIYGALYNWYAVETGRLCPVGWRVLLMLN